MTKFVGLRAKDYSYLIMQVIDLIGTCAYETSKDLVSKKEEKIRKNIVKQYKN